MDKVLVLTDLHLRSNGQTIIGLDPLRRLEAVLDAALADHGDASALVLLGDLAHSGKPEEYRQLSEALEEVPIPILPMIGNHDRREAFLGAFPAAPVTSSGHVQAVLDLPGHRIITLDTLDGPPYPARHHSGRLCADRMGWLRAALEGAGGRIPLVFAHHPPMPIGLPFMDDIRLRDGAALLDLLSGFPRCHLFCGHIHRTISGSAAGVPFTLFKSPCHQSPLDLVSHDTSLSVDEPGAYGLLLLTEHGVIVHSEDVGPRRPPVLSSRDVLPEV